MPETFGIKKNRKWQLKLGGGYFSGWVGAQKILHNFMDGVQLAVWVSK